MSNKVAIVGAGLAGCEAAMQLARMDVEVALFEMRPDVSTQAHQTSDLAELVCSNSLRSHDAAANAVGVLHREMQALNSIVI
ncbi:MAG: FAD-dependent oxidoreductase, partial [Pseudomonadota bacterium]